jgi:hypothetical protein
MPCGCVQVTTYGDPHTVIRIRWSAFGDALTVSDDHFNGVNRDFVSSSMVAVASAKVDLCLRLLRMLRFAFEQSILEHSNKVF